MNRKRFTVKKASISDKIYFNKKDIVEDPSDVYYDFFNYNIEDRFVSTWDEVEGTDEVSVPSGSFFKINFEELEDNRVAYEKQDWKFSGTLKPDQQEVANKLFNKDKLYSGLVKAPCGWGKSFLGAYLIANNGKPTAIIVHTKLLAYQWYDALKELIPDVPIGFIGDGRLEVENITVCIYKSLINNLDTLKNRFELVIVDEAHLCPADTFSKVVNGLSARTKIALSATPVRKDGLHVFLPDYFGPNRILVEDKSKIIPYVEVVKTDIPFRIRNPVRDWALAINKIAQDDNYIDLICEIANNKIAHGRCLLILSERIEMLRRLNSKLENSKLLVGATKNTEREFILENAGKSIDVILSTKIFDEGISCHRLDTILFTTPQNNYSKLEQRIGRIQREHPDKKHPLIVDFWLKGPIVKGTQEKRLEWYKKQHFKIL